MLNWCSTRLGTRSNSFNVYTNDLLLSDAESSDICNFADDDTLYEFKPTIGVVICQLKLDLQFAITWFNINGLVANPEKFQIIFSSTDISISFNIGSCTFTNSKQVKLFGITIDSKLFFLPHTQSLCKVVHSKTKAL